VRTNEDILEAVELKQIARWERAQDRLCAAVTAYCLLTQGKRSDLAIPGRVYSAALRRLEALIEVCLRDLGEDV
jgi:hypothetical protein